MFCLPVPIEAANLCAPSAAPGGGCTNSYASMQAAINAAVAGDTVYGHAGTTYTEWITLPNKGALASYITITTDAGAGSLPAAGVRMVGATYAAFLPKLKSPGAGVSAVVTAVGANHYKFTFIEFPNVPLGYNDMFSIGVNDATQAFETQEPYSFIIDQCYFHGDTVAGQRRALEINGKDITVTNSDFRQITAVGQDTQCIAGFNGHGPVDLENNYFECGTENVIFGGADPAMRTLLHVTGSATTTGAAVATYESGHTLAELVVGQIVAVQTGTSTVEFSYLTVISGTGATGTLTWSPALVAVPLTPGDIRTGVILNGLTVRRNYFIKNTAWQAGVLAAPTSVSAVASTASGTLAAGTYCYKAQGFAAGYQGNPVNSAASSESCATLTATGKVTVTYVVTPNATTHRMYRGTVAAGEDRWTDATASTTFVDDGTPSYTVAGIAATTFWQVKNLFELKAVQNAQVDSNVFDYGWTGVDIGLTAMWLKSVNQDGAAWWIESKNITIEKNLWRHTNGVAVINGKETNGTARDRPPAISNLTIKNNMFLDASSATMQEGTVSCAFIINNAVNLVLDHNTIDSPNANCLISAEGTDTSPVITNNMVRRGTYGIHYSGTSEGTPALAAIMPGYTFQKNNVSDANSSIYPASNFFDASAAWQAHFTSYAADGSGNYAILGGSAMHNAGLDGKDVGADVAAVLAATAGVTTGSTTTLSITTPSVPTAVRTVAYSKTLTATGGTAPYTAWAITVGSLPTGLTLSTPGGVISGTPTAAAGTYSFTARVTDTPAATASQAYTLTLLDAVSITTTSPLPAATQNSAYTTTIAFTGGQTPFACSISVGVLPTGLSINASTCVISGTPTVVSNPSFTIRVADTLGSVATLAATLAVAAETLPCGRPIRTGPIGAEGAVFRRGTAPTAADCVAAGDLWMNTAMNPASIYVATSQTPTWAQVAGGSSLSGDGSMLTNLNASQLLTGTIPGTAFPAAMSIAASVTAPTLNATTVGATGYLELTESTCQSLSPSARARICMDLADHTLKSSVNGADYAVLGSATGSSSSGTAPSLVGPSAYSTDVVFTEETTDPYAMGDDTSKTAGIAIRAQQGVRRQIFRTHDSNSGTGYVWGAGVSSDSGATWLFPWRIRQDGELHLKSVVLEDSAQTIGARLKTDAAPTTGTCGTSPSVTSGSTPFAGSVNVGTGGTATSCTVNFNGTAFPTAPFCLATPTTTNAVTRASASATVLTLSSTTAWTASDVIQWICVGPRS